MKITISENTIFCSWITDTDSLVGLSMSASL